MSIPDIKTNGSKDKSDPEALEERIERLEKRLDETSDGEGATIANTTRTAIDKSESGDPLRRAVDRAKEKRDQG